MNLVKLTSPSFVRLIARIAVFAMLCQALLPTAVYTTVSHDPARLAQMARAFGVPDKSAQSAASAAHAHHHHVDSTDVAPAQIAASSQTDTHDHGVHCSLCLAHAFDLALVVLLMPDALSLPFDHAYPALFDSNFVPHPPRNIMPRWPPQQVPTFFV